MMENRFDDLLNEGVKVLSERLIADEYPIGKKNYFIHDPVLDQLFFHTFCDLLVSRTAYAEMVSEFIKADTKEQNAFDEKLRARVYDVVYEAQGGLR
jgi:hypothetical protein